MMLTTALHAGNEEELFLRGNKYYQHNDYDNALASYELLQVKGRAVLYNMGNCYYQKNDYAQALAYWARAQEGATQKELAIIERNTHHVLKKLGKQTQQSFMQKITSVFHLSTAYFSLLILQFIFLFCWYFLIFLFYKRKGVKKSLAVLLCATIVVIGTALSVEYSKYYTSFGIVACKQGFIFAGPDKGFHTLCPLTYADTVVIKEKREGWYKIGYTGIIGWVEAGVIHIV